MLNKGFVRNNSDPSPDRHTLPPFIAEIRSRLFQDVLDKARQVARFDSSVLISGETGTGKEIIARYIQWCSPRKKNSMVTINCGALPETLLESELFGHKAGSFTGAINDRVGLFEQAARGTVFLDEIGDTSKAIQIKLLRVLQEREILRIGENIPRKVDIRVIASTNSDLERAITEGKFRTDLLYRLRVIELRVPPLRERLEDIVPLVEFFITRLARQLRIRGLRLDRECLARLQTYRWPGNVRELQNAIEHAAIICGDGIVRLKHLPAQITDPGQSRATADGIVPRTLAEAELDYIKAILLSTGGNRARAARLLGIGQTTLWRKLKKAGMPPKGGT
jgi:two-component system response regulator HydG